MKFSQRIGKTPLTKEIQLESIDKDLKNGLWDIYHLFIINRISTEFSNIFRVTPSDIFSKKLWHQYFKEPVDKIPEYFSDVEEVIRSYFFNSSWYEVYDLIEVTIVLKSNRSNYLIVLIKFLKGSLPAIGLLKEYYHR